VAAPPAWNRNEAAEKYRAFAEGCKKLAQTARTVEHRAVLLHIADEWLRLAREVEQSGAAGARNRGADEDLPR
jgi:hypothetical protein